MPTRADRLSGLQRLSARGLDLMFCFRSNIGNRDFCRIQDAGPRFHKGRDRAHARSGRAPAQRDASAPARRYSNSQRGSSLATHARQNRFPLRGAGPAEGRTTEAEGQSSRRPKVVTQKYFADDPDAPPFIKALAEVRRLAAREGWCYQHVQAISVAIDQYAARRHSAIGIIFWTSPTG